MPFEKVSLPLIRQLSTTSAPAELLKFTLPKTPLPFPEITCFKEPDRIIPPDVDELECVLLFSIFRRTVTVLELSKNVPVFSKRSAAIRISAFVKASEERVFTFRLAKLVIFVPVPVICCAAIPLKLVIWVVFTA